MRFRIILARRRLWVSTGLSVLCFDRDEWTEWRGDASRWIISFAIGYDGTVWGGTRHGLTRFDGQDWTVHTVEVGLPANHLTSLALARDGNVWMATYGGGVSMFDGQEWSTHDEEDGIVDNHVISLALGPDDTVWAGTHRGVSVFDGRSWATHRTADGRAQDSVRSLAVADDGTVWAATRWSNSGTGALAKFDGHRWVAYTAADGLAHDVVISVAVGRDGTVWAVTSQGVSAFDGHEWATYTTADGLHSHRRLDAVMVARDGTVWVGGDDGVSAFDGQEWTTYRAPIPPHNHIACLAEGPDGAVWAGTRSESGLFVLPPTRQGWHRYTTADGLTDNDVAAVAVDDENTVWIATGLGLSIFTQPA